MTAPTAEVWYRYDDVLYSAGVDEWDNSLGPGRVELVLRRYPVLKTTPKGVWLNVHGDHRFVLRGARKRFACPTPLEARESFRARKARQIKIHMAAVSRANRAMYLLDSRHP